MKEFLSKNKWPLLLAVAAVLVRLIYLIELSRQPGFNVLMVDEQWHWQWAQEILDKSFWGEGSYFRGPLYPYFLALLYLITGASIFWAKAIQILICGGTSFFIFKIAEHLFNKKAAVLSGIVYAFYGTLVFYETMFLIPVIFLFLTVWGMYRLIAYQDSVSLKTWIFTGIIFGLSALARPNILLVIPFLALWLFFKHRKTKEVLSQAVRPALLMIFGLILAIAPVTIRNIAVTGDFMLISSQGGVNLYLGNNEYADGLTMMMPEVELDQSISWDMFIPVTNSIAEEETGREMTDSEISSFWTAKTLDFIASNPGKFLDLVWRKSVYLVSGFENSDATDIYYQRNKSTLYSILLWDSFISFPFGLLVPFFIFGVIVLRTEFKKLFPIYILILAYIPTIVLFLVTARHRLVLIPFMIIIAAAGLIQFKRKIKEFGFMNLAALLSLFVISIVVLNQKYYDLGEPNPFYIHYNNGLTFQKLGQYDKAIKEYQLADRIFPFSAALAGNLAYCQFETGKTAMADQNLGRAIALKPQMAINYNNLGLLVRSKGEIDSSIVLFKKAIERYKENVTRPNEIGEYFVNLGTSYEQKSLVDSAEWAYKEAMRRSPLYPEAYYKAALFFAGQKRFDESDSLYVEGMRVRLPKADEEYNWGMSYIEREMYNEGVGMMMRAIKSDREFYRAYYVVAAIYNRFGEPRDTVNTYLNKCLNIKPDFEPALQLKNSLGDN